MQHPTLRSWRMALALGLAVGLAGCGDSRDDRVSEFAGRPTEERATPPPPAPVATDDADGCFVHLYDGENFRDDNFIVKGPGRFADLSSLPGAVKDWTDEADSFKVGPSATVEMWPEKEFKGTPEVFQPGTEVPKVDHEPESMVITC